MLENKHSQTGFYKLDMANYALSSLKEAIYREKVTFSPLLKFYRLSQ
jgi:hypothetical protein